MKLSLEFEYNMLVNVGSYIFQLLIYLLFLLYDFKSA